MDLQQVNRMHPLGYPTFCTIHELIASKMKGMLSLMKIGSTQSLYENCQAIFCFLPALLKAFLQPSFEVWAFAARVHYLLLFFIGLQNK